MKSRTALSTLQTFSQRAKSGDISHSPLSFNFSPSKMFSYLGGNDFVKGVDGGSDRRGRRSRVRFVEQLKSRLVPGSICKNTEAKCKSARG
jgi:hypothetical protein